MNLLLLLLAELILFIAICHFNKSDFLDPVVFSIFVFIIATFSSIIGNMTWNIEFSLYSMFIVLIGLIAMASGNAFAKLANSNLLNKRIRKFSYQPHEINISSWKVWVIIGLSVVLTALYIIDILHAGKLLGVSGLKAISVVRRSDKATTNAIIRQGIKFIMAAGFVNGFIFSNNFIINCKRKTNFLYLIPSICGCVCSIFTGVRTEILRIIIAIFVSFYILLQEKNNWKNGSNKKVIKLFLPAVFIALILFVEVKNIIKGPDLATNHVYNTFEYIIYYIGTPLIVLGEKINIGITNYKGIFWGELTFNSVWFDLADFNLVNASLLQNGSANIIINSKERIAANVDTILGPALIDFDISGMFVFIFLVYFFLSYYYYNKIKYTSSSLKRNKSIIVYSHLFIIIAMSYYANLAGKFFSIYFILTLIFIYIIYWFYFKTKLFKR